MKDKIIRQEEQGSAKCIIDVGDAIEIYGKSSIIIRFVFHLKDRKVDLGRFCAMDFCIRYEACSERDRGVNFILVDLINP